MFDVNSENLLTKTIIICILIISYSLRNIKNILELFNRLSIIKDIRVDCQINYINLYQS